MFFAQFIAKRLLNFTNLMGKLVLASAAFIVILTVFFNLWAGKNAPKNNLDDQIKAQRVEIYKKLKDPALQNPQGKASLGLYRMWMCTTIGETCSENPKDTVANDYNKSLFAKASGLLIAPYMNPPASGIAYTQQTLASAGFLPKVYAAEGIGFASIKPLSEIWRKFRDVSYLILVLLIVAIGFMIMFRMKLNPQTVIGIENALPRIIMALIFITFSFPIAGFLIDLMYIVTAVMISLVAPIGGLGVGALQAKYLQAGPIDILSLLSGSTGDFFNILNIFWHIPNALLGMFGFIGALVHFVGGFVGFFFILPFLMNFFRSVATFLGIQLVGTPLGVGPTTGETIKGAAELIHWPVAIGLAITFGAIFLIPLIMGVLILFTVIFLFFRILFMLLSSYIKIFLFIILSPLILMFEAIPGKSTFSSWLKSLISEIITFPLLIGILLLSSVILNSSVGNNYFKLPFFYDVDANLLRILIGMAFLFMTPDLIMLAKQVLVPKPLPIPEAGPGIFFGGATTGINAGIGEFSKWSSLAFYNPAIGKMLSFIPGMNKQGGHGGHGGQRDIQNETV